MPGRRGFPAPGRDAPTIARSMPATSATAPIRSSSSASRTADLVLVVGARLGEATTDGYTLHHPRPSRPGAGPRPPDPNELGRVYRTDLAICADMREFAESAALWPDGLIDFDCGKKAHDEFLAWSTPAPTDTPLDLGMCVEAMRDTLPADSIICNGAGNYSGWWHRYWHYADRHAARPDRGSDGLWPSRRRRRGVAPPDRAGGRAGGRRLFPDERAGAGDRGPAWARHARHRRRQRHLRHDPHAPGTRISRPRSATSLANPDFAAFAKSFGCWAETVEKTDDFAPALKLAQAERGVRLLHLKTDPDRISFGTTITALRAKK